MQEIYELIWLWVVIELKNKQILFFHIFKERNMYLLKNDFCHKSYKNMGCIQFHRMAVLDPQACRFLKLKHHLHSSYEKSIIEITIQYVKDRI